MDTRAVHILIYCMRLQCTMICSQSIDAEIYMVTSFFSFPHNVFYPFKDKFCLFRHMSILLINPFPDKPWFSRVCNKSPLKTPWEKETLLIMRTLYKTFLPFSSNSELLSATSFILEESKICRLGKG